MSGEQDRWDILIRGIRAGDRAVEAEFWDLYGESLQRLAEKNLAVPMRRRMDPEDAVQSAYRTFLRRARMNQFRFADSEDLWRLLCSITLHKLRKKVRFHLQQKRSLNREVHEQPSAAGVSAVSDPAPNPQQAAELAEQFQLLLASMEQFERRVAELKLEEYTNREIADRLGCSERTVERNLNRLRAQLTRDWETGPQGCPD